MKKTTKVILWSVLNLIISVVVGWIVRAFVGLDIATSALIVGMAWILLWGAVGIVTLIWDLIF